MAFLGSLGKFVGGIVAPAVKAIPAALSGFATGGKAGALLGGLGALQAGQGGVPQQPGFGAGSIFSGVQTSLAGPFGFPQTPQVTRMMQPQPMIQTGGAVQLTQNIFNIILKMAQALGIVIKSPGGVARMGRRLIAKLLRFARANPGLTILNLLVNLGLTVFEAQELLVWFTTSTKKRRRMKVTNVHALNRSVRRLEGFRRLSHRVEAALTRRGASRPLARSRRCPRCRKNPCCC